MNSEEKKFDIPLTVSELGIIIDALNSHYIKSVNRLQKREDRTGEPRKLKDTKRLADIQMVLQYVLLKRNIVTNQLNEAVAASAGIQQNKEGEEEEVSNSSGEQELAGDEGETTSDT